MKTKIEIGNKTFEADLNEGIDISIAVGKPNEVNAYGIPTSEITTYIDGGFVGDVLKGGSCNVKDIKFNPHGNGTHTECVGHVSNDYVTIPQIQIPSHFTARLISIETSDFVSRKSLEHLLAEPKTQGLIIRTLPNNDSKTSKNHTGASAVFIHPEAMELICELGIEHLIVDLPSVDHESDPVLQSHKIFWDIKNAEISNKTITELVYIPNHVNDGLFLVNLMIPSMYCDAVPSKPILYHLR